MENKSNSLNRIKRHQREKVLRFSIRKYSFGAASVAVAALMFLGARVVSADTVSGSNSQSTAGVVQPNDKGNSPVGIKEPTENKSEVVNSSLENKETALVENSSNTVDKSQLRTVVEELNSLLSTKLNLDDSVLSSVKERVQRAQALLDKVDAVQKDVNELKELLSTDLATLSNAVKESSEVRESNTGTEAEKPASQPSSEVRASEENQTVSAKKDSLKVSVDQLKAAISEVPEHDTTKKVLEKANELLGAAQGALENTTVSLNDVEEMTKRVKRMFISVKNATTRLTSGSHDPRNGKSMDQGTGFRANGELVEGALSNVKEYISEPAGHGSTVEGNRPKTIEKTFMKATYSKEGDKKFITYDVYFQNDGKALDGIYKNAFWFYPPRDLLYDAGRSYPVGVVSEAYYERYKKKEGATGTLSENPNNFTREGERYNVPLGALNVRNGFQDYNSQNLWKNAGGIYQLSGGPNSNDQRQQMLKQLQYNEDLNRIIKLNNNPNGSYPGASYSHLLTVGSGQNYAYKYHVKMRLKDNVTDAQARTAGTIAVTAKEGYAKTALAAYVYAATGTRLVSKPVTPSIPTNLTGKAGTRTQIEVDAEAGVSVVVYDHGGKELGRGEANTSGKAFIKPTKDIPSGKVTAKAIDKAGNVSDPSNPQVATAPVPNPITVSPFTHGDTSVTLRPNGKTDIVYATIRGNGIKYEKQANGNYRELSNPSRMSFRANQDGTITIGLPQGQQLQAGDRVVTRAENSDITSNTGTRASAEEEGYGQLKRSDKVPVKDPSNLSPTDKERVKAAVLKANPGIKVADLTIAKNGDVTYNHRGEGSNVKREIQLKDNVNRDNVAPGKPTIETPLLGKAGTRTPITVQTEAGAKVELFDSKNRKIGEKVAGNQGRVTIEPKIDLVAGNVTAKATDEAGNISQPSDPKQVTYPLTNQPIINIKQGENLTAAEIKQTVLLQNANGTTNLPNNAQVTGNFDTSSVGVKRTTVTVRFPDAPEQQVEVTYKVLPTFPIARTVYDFKGMDHGNDESGYYVNPRNLPSGMVWVAKRNGEQEQSASKLREMLKADPVGTKTYTFSGKYNHGRFTNNPTDAQKLAHTGTFEHKVFDVEANRTRVTVSKGATLTEQNAKDAVAKVAGSENLPTGTTYEWVDNHGNKQNPVANTPGVQNYRVKVTLPMSQTGANQPDATQKRPSKIIDVKVNVKPDVPTYNTTIKANGNIKVPTVASTDRELTGTGAPGAKIKVTVPGVTINEVTVGSNGKWTVTLPKGLNSNQLNQTQLVPQDQVTITQSVGGVESDPVNVAVSLGETTIQPSVASKDRVSLVAGTKNIVVKTPHDAGMVYVSYTDKATGKAHEIGLKRENINSPWVSIKPTLGVVTNTSKDAFTNNITIEMKESIAEGTAKAIANISEGKYSSAVDWKTIQVTNQAPTVTSAVAGNEKVLEFGENIDLKTLVTKADYEDDKDATRGTKVRTEIVSVNGQNNVKDINSRKPGTYIVKYKAIDSQGKESGEIQLTVKVREDKPTPPTATAPSDGTVTVTPTGDADKVIVNYTDEKNAQKTVTVVKAKNGTWSSSDKPAGVTVDPRTGALLIPEDGVRDRSQVTATATKGDSRPSDPKIVTAQQRDFVPVVPDKTPVTKVTNLTPEEREKVKAKVQTRNPGKNISISTDGTATLTDPKTNISHQISGDKLVESNDKIKPTVEIPYDNVNKQEVYVYSGETNNITIKVKDNSGKISKSYLVFAANDRRGLGTEDNSYLGGGSSNGLYLTATKIHSDTPTSENQPATITVSGNLNNQPFTGEKSITRYVFAEDPSGNTNYDHVGRTDDTGALGRVKFVWKSQTSKYDAQAPGTPLLLDNADATQIENAVKQANPTFSDKIKSVTVNGNNVIVTYKDDSTDRLDASKVFKVRDSKPTPPTATAPSDGTVTVTPTGDADKVTVNYTDEKEQNKTVTVVKDKNGTWSSSDKPAGVTVDSSTGQLLIPAEGVKDKSQVTATATKGDSHPSEPTTVTAQAKDFTPVKPDEKVVVQDKSHLTPEEKKQVEDKVKAKNPGKTVTVGDDGTATVTDPSTKISHPIAGKDLVNEGFTPVKPDEKVVVQDKSHLTPEEKKQVEDKVKAKNPGKTVTVGDDGTATVTDPSTKISHPIAGKDLVIEDFTPVKPDEKVVVQDKSHLTPEEKKQVEDKVKAKNPGKTVTVGDDGTATVTDPSTKISHPIAGKDLVIEDFTPVKPDEKVVVQDKSHLTPEEKKQVEDKVKAKNPGKTVTVGDDGTATVTDPSTKISYPIAGKDLVIEDFTPVKPDEKVVVQDKSHLTPEEKKQVEDKVKAKNPGKTVTVGDDGTATVTDPSTKISHPIAGKDLVNEGFTPVKPDEKVVVQDKSHLTPEEKKQVEDKVKAKNPGKTVTVGDDGTATVTDPSTKISHPIAGKDLVIEDFTPVKPDEKVVVQDKSHLTPEEKKQVEDKVKAKNPGKTVTVGDDGTATVTDPSTKISHPIAGKDLVIEGFTPVKPDEKVVVQDKSHLTPEEKKQVEDKVKAKNPGKTVTVGDDGTATVTDPSTKISHPIAGKDLVNQDFTPVKPDEKVVVQDKSHLTPEEKKQVEDKVKAKNPGKTVTVGDDGTATVTDPSTKISHPIAGKDLVNQDFTPVKPDEKVVVQDKSHLTPEEKKQVEDKVKAKNPGKTVTVGDDGTATVTDPSTKISHPIAGKDLVNEGFTPVKPDEKVVVQDKSHLTPEEKKQVEDKVKAKNPGKTVTVGDDGTATVTDPSTKISHPIAGKDLVIEDFTPVKPDEKVVVQDKSHLTPEEKKQVEDKVKAKNPGKTVTVGDDGTATVTDPSTKISHPIAGKDLVIEDFTPVKPDEKVVVQDKSHLTPEEKKQVEDKVKAKNPGKTVTVGDDGTATVTDPSTKISHPIAGKDLVIEDFTPVKPDEKVVVQDKSHLTPEEKKQVEDKVKAKNPGKTVTVGDDGTATVTDPSTKISHPIAGKDLVIEDFTPVKPDEKVVVQDKSHLTPEEKKQVEDKVKAKNPGKTVTVGDDGTATVTDPSTKISHPIAGKDLVNEGFTPVKPDEKVVVQDKSHLTPEEKKQVEDKVKAKNPGKTVTVGDDGTATVTDPSTKISHPIAGKDLVIEDFTPVKPDEKVVVQDKSHLTPEEKKQVEDKVKAKNPGKTVTVGDDGTATVTDPSTKISHPIAGKDLVNEGFTPVKPDEKVVVQDKSHLTPEEKKQVEDKVKAKNPGKTVTVGDDGTATVTDPSTKISHPIAGKDLVIEDFTPVKPDEKVVVQDKSHLTPEEKKQVEDKVKAKNPGKTVTVGDDGTATVTDPSTKISHPIAGKDLVNEGFTPVKPDEKVVVQDKSHLTPEEKKQVEDKVKAKNPGKTVTVGDDGTATVTDPSTKISHPIAGKDLVIEDFTPVKPDEKVVVQDKSHLTPEEKKQVEDKVKAKNPGKTVTVGDDGTATVTDPSTKISHPIAGKDLVIEDFTPVKPDEKVVVQDKSHLTPEEKKQVEDKVKAKNPGKTVTVGDDGTATVTDPSTKISHPIAGKDLVNEGFTPVKPDEKVVVQDKSHLTPEEKKQVEDKVKAKNPGKTVTVGDDGTATVTDPSTKISHPIAGKDLVNEDFTPVKPDEKVVVQDKSHLTPEEKKQVEDKVKAKNPGKTVTVGDDGTATVTDPSTKISHPIAGKDLVIEGFGVNGIPEVTPSQPEYTGPISSNGVDGNGNLIDPPTVELPEFNGGVNGELPDPVELPKVKLIITKWIDEQGNELKPADAKAPAVLGEANEALEAGEIAGYVFVRTDVNEEGDVVTHVFRKVTPTKPEGNGEQQGGDNTPQPTPEVPTDNTERKPETEKPTVPDTKQAEQPTQTVDAQVAPSQNQAVLPNTGTKADRATGALGALSLLGAFGLLFAKKKKDDEEETRNN